ncbi:MAG: DUF998 domain-containing protein [Desulfurococcaceae archaeon]|nr:DUF998 domain-containing protein [Desulfurococcaceae archaeon]
MVGTYVRRCTTLVLAMYAVPLLFIATAASLSGWFNIYRNALSDLGHATRSNVAPVFNLGLSLGAFLLAAFALTYSARVSRAVSASILLMAFTLNLVAVFDEVYRSLHFWVSAAFFVSIAATLATYAVVFKDPLVPSVAIAIGVASWVLHLVYRIPPGAAIPELISVFVSTAVIVRYAARVCRDRST